MILSTARGRLESKRLLLLYYEIVVAAAFTGKNVITAQVLTGPN